MANRRMFSSTKVEIKKNKKLPRTIVHSSQVEIKYQL